MKAIKRPIQIEAVQYLGPRAEEDGRVLPSFNEYPLWLVGALKSGTIVLGGSYTETIEIITNHGTALASPNDWIIKGLGDELYPATAAVFESTYDLVPELDS